MFSDGTPSKLSDFYHREPGPCRCIKDIVDAKNTAIQEGHNHSESSITVEVSLWSQKVDNYLENEQSRLDAFSTHLAKIFGSNVGNENGLMLTNKWTSQNKSCLRHCPRTFPHDIHTPDWVQYCWHHDGPNAAMLSILFKDYTWDTITAGQQTNCQTFGNLQFRPLLKNSFHGFHID